MLWEVNLETDLTDRERGMIAEIREKTGMSVKEILSDAVKWYCEFIENGGNVDEFLRQFEK